MFVVIAYFSRSSAPAHKSGFSLLRGGRVRPAKTMWCKQSNFREKKFKNPKKKNLKEKKQKNHQLRQYVCVCVCMRACAMPDRGIWAICGSSLWCFFCKYRFFAFLFASVAFSIRYDTLYSLSVLSSKLGAFLNVFWFLGHIWQRNG